MKLLFHAFNLGMIIVLVYFLLERSDPARVLTTAEKVAEVYRPFVIAVYLFLTWIIGAAALGALALVSRGPITLVPVDSHPPKYFQRILLGAVALASFASLIGLGS